MLRTNEAGWDRAVRLLAGGVLLYLGLAGVTASWLAVVLVVLGAVLMITGLIGWCALYALLGISTKHREARGVT